MSQTLSRGSLIGCELGHYRVVEKIGEGGMGEVFLAHDEHLGHNVALKVLPPETDEHSRHLFRKEAHALSKLNHPNIVTVLDFDTQQDVDFLVMEYVPGMALDEQAHQRPMAEQEILRIGVQLAEGLAAAHEQGIVHRDLKPGNLRLTKDNRLKILDFGLARPTFSFNPQASTVSLEAQPSCSGTLPYMPAEQVLGKNLDARADIYSAGVVLYELCTGHPPFQQELFPALVEEILHKPPVPPRQLRPDISPGLEAIVLRCLEKDPEKRYQSAAEFARDLRILAQSARARALAWTRTARLVSYAALFLILLLLFARGGGGIFWPGARAPAPRISSLAVLPFANLSADPQHEYLADTLTDFLITDLGQMHALQRIISRTSVIGFKAEHQPLPAIGRQLKVDAVVEGSVARSESRVQVSVRLISTADDRQLWSHSYECDFRDLTALRHELALAIVRAIRSNLGDGGRAHLATARPVDPAAQEAYLRAKYLQLGTSEQRARARQYFEEAVRLDPNYAIAYAGLADSYWNDISLPAREAMPKAREYATKAVSLDDLLAHAHTTLATIHFYADWDWNAADREYQRALELNPNDAEAHRMHSVFLAAMGRTDEALAQVLSAQEIDPLYVGNNTTAAWVLYCARRHDQALQYCQKALELTPNDESSHACLSYNYLEKGLFQPAIEEGSKAWDLSGKQPIWAVLLGRAYAQSGNTSQAARTLHELLMRSRQSYIPPTFIAALYTALEDKENAFRWLDKAYAERDLYLAWIKVDPALDPLRPDARFQELQKRVGLTN